MHPFLHHYDIGFITGTHIFYRHLSHWKQGVKKVTAQRAKIKKNKNHQEMYEVTKKFNLSKSRCLVSFFGVSAQTEGNRGI